MDFILTREYLISLLQDWKDNRITASDVLSTTSKIYSDDYDVTDWEKEGGWDCDDNHSIAQEVMSDLESLDTDLITQDDIDAYVELLQTPIGQYEQGIKKFWKNRKKDFEERKKQLQGVPPYLVWIEPEEKEPTSIFWKILKFFM